MKYVVYAIQYKVFRRERLTGAGGMPSSHSSGVCTLITVMARSPLAGFSSPIFAMSLIFGLVVMYDAAGVRRAAGLHAKVINMLKKTIDEADGIDVQEDSDKPMKELKEFVGHTPLEVFCGALVGIVIGLLCKV